MLHHLHGAALCIQGDYCLYKKCRCGCVKIWFAGSTDGSETGSDEGSPLGPKGGGTLKTCAICLEDYRYKLEVSLQSLRGRPPFNSFMA